MNCISGFSSCHKFVPLFFRQVSKRSSFENMVCKTVRLDTIRALLGRKDPDPFLATRTSREATYEVLIGKIEKTFPKQRKSSCCFFCCWKMLVIWVVVALCLTENLAQTLYPTASPTLSQGWAYFSSYQQPSCSGNVYAVVAKPLNTCIPQYNLTSIIYYYKYSCDSSKFIIKI